MMPVGIVSGGPVPPSKAGGVEQAARQLEVTFLTQLLQAMRKTVPESDFLPKSPERDVYNGAFDTAAAEALAAQDPLGIVATVTHGSAGSSSQGEMSITKTEGQRSSTP